MAGRTEYKNNWQNDHLDRINLTMPKGSKATVQAHADTRGESTNAFINRAIRETIKRDLRLDELEQLAVKWAAENGVPIENAREDVQIMDALTTLEPTMPRIKALYFFRKYPKTEPVKLERC